MRTDVKVAAISFAVVLGACNSRQEKATGLSEDLKRDLAAASAPGDLATAPRAYERTRFVSEVEMNRANKPVPKVVASKRWQEGYIKRNLLTPVDWTGEEANKYLDGLRGKYEKALGEMGALKK